MLRDGLLLSLDPHVCRVTSPHIGVLIPSGALQKELNRQQKREKFNTRGIDSGKCPSGGQELQVNRFTLHPSSRLERSANDPVGLC